MAGYGYNDAKYVRADEGQQGHSIGSPKNIANFYTSYKIPTGKAKGLGLGFGANYVGESDFQYPVVIPSYFITNAQIMYDQPRFTLTVKVNNLGDERYWSWNFIQAQPPRNYVVGISYKF